MAEPRSGVRIQAFAARLALTGIAALFFAACVQDDGERFNPLDFIVGKVSDDDERQLGMEFDRELQNVVRVIHDPVVSEFINELGQAVVRQIEPQPFIYRFRVIDDPTLNAFAVPGGYVYFHSGTITSVASVDELAGVMGHEIAHVKQHHYARMRKQSQIPDLLVGLAGMAAAVAANEPGLLVASQAANVAMKLRYSREYEAEADQYGTVFMVRAGYDPKGTVRFFERILEEEKLHPNDIPPYLFSHPDVADRIGSIEIASESLHPAQSPDPDLTSALPIVQARLSKLTEANRTSLPQPSASLDRAQPEPALDEAAALEAAGDSDAALRRLAAARQANPDDPRIPYQMGEIYYATGRYADAAESYRRTIALDASRAKVFFQLGLAYKEAGDRPRAVHAFEQAAVRAGATSSVRERAQWEVFKLTFTIVAESGFADGQRRGDTPVGATRDAFREGERRLAWWARLNPRFKDYAEIFVLRWIAPDGSVVQEEEVELFGPTLIGARLDLESGATAGSWTAELLLRGDSIERRTIQVQPRDG